MDRAWPRVPRSSHARVTPFHSPESFSILPGGYQALFGFSDVDFLSFNILHLFVSKTAVVSTLNFTMVNVTKGVLVEW